MHGEHYLEFMKPIPFKGTVKTTEKIIEVLDKRSGASVTILGAERGKLHDKN